MISLRQGGNTTPKRGVRQNSETLKFWRTSVNIRRNLEPPEVIDYEITIFLSKPGSISQWLFDRLTELRELNRARFKG